MAATQQHRLRTALLVGRSAANGSGLRSALQQRAEQVLAAASAAAAVQCLAHAPVELILVDADVPAAEAEGLVRAARMASPCSRAVVLTKRPSVEAAIAFMRAGAHDYLGAPLDAERLDRVVEGIATSRRPARPEERFFCDDCPPGVPIVGLSEAMVEALQILRAVAESHCNPMLLMGETGTGKELAARAVHAWRCGDEQPFVAVNCAALTANLLESELFGHVKGAFTGADREKTGLLELAGGGTVFLDEISEMPLELQAKLLRVLQERTFRKVGGTEDHLCQATVIASSNRDLLAEANAGKFRKDLYYRLAVFPITLPPLRSARRRGDVLLLARYFVETSEIVRKTAVCGFTPGAEEILLAHDWRGNVRELRNVVERALILEGSEQITPSSLRLDRSEPLQPAPSKAKKDFSLETAERQFILRALQETGWQRTRAAALLGITRATLHAKLKRYDIHPPDAADAPSAGKELAAAGV